MNKIQRVSYWFRVFFQVCFVLLPIFLLLSWVFVTQQDFQAAHPHFFLSPVPQNLLTTPVLQSLSVTTKLLGFLINCIPTGISMLIFYFLIRLFKLYERMEIFTLTNVKYIRNIGYAMLASQIVNPIYQGLITMVLTFNNPHGYRQATIGFASTDIMSLVIALIIILVSWIMAEGCKLHDDQKYTI